jgi:hypothetical protein
VRRARTLASVESAPRRSLEAVARPVLVPAPAIEPGEGTDTSLSAGSDGLPKRVRQASLAPQLRGEPAGPLTLDRVDAEPPPRTAEQARATMAALQAGTARGRRDADAIPLTRRRPDAAPLARRDPDDLPFAGRGLDAPVGLEVSETQFIPLATRPTRQLDPAPAEEGDIVPPARGTATPPAGAVVSPPSTGETPEVVDGLPRRKRGASADGPPTRRSTSGGLPRRKAGGGAPAGEDGKATRDKTPPAEPEGDE